MFPFSSPKFAEFQESLGGRALDGVATMSELEHSFQLERTRYPRTGGHVSLVVFLPVGDESASLPALVGVVRGRVRTTDVLGWLDSERLAILLPETNKLSAWVLAGGILESLARPTPSFQCEVFTYPTDWPAHACEPARASGSGAALRPLVPMPIAPAM